MRPNPSKPATRRGDIDRSFGGGDSGLDLTLYPLPRMQTRTRVRDRSVAEHGLPVHGATGEELFASACQGCHMPDGKGAVGAGNYPSLSKDGNLEAGGYPVYVVVRGQRAMPPVGVMMNDDQVAAVVNYVRTHFGNQYRDAVTADDVKRVRPSNDRP